MSEYAQYFEALQIEPNDQNVMQALQRLAQDGLGHDPGAAKAFADARRLHRDRGELELTVRLFDVEMMTTTETASLADLLFAKGKVLMDDLLDEWAALECFRRVLELRPGDIDAQDEIAHIGLVHENWEKIVRKFLEEARVSTDRQLTTSLYLSVAETYARHRPDAPEVEQYLRRALEIEPKNRRAGQHLERFLRKAGRFDEVAKLLELRAEMAGQRDERLHTLMSLAELAGTHLGRPELGLDCMRKVLALDPANPRALRALVQAYSAPGQEDWASLVKIYENALRSRSRAGVALGGTELQPHAGTVEHELGLCLQAAMLHWKRLGSMDSAEEYFRRIRKLDPSHEVMLDFYRLYHGERSEGQKLLQVLQSAHRVLEDSERRTALALEIATLAEREVKNPEKAIESWKLLLRQNPKHPKHEEARAALKRLYHRTEKWNALLELVKDEIEAIPVDTEEGRAARAHRLLEVVAIYRDRLNLDVMVINTYNTILGLCPDHRSALDALAEKYEKLGRWNDLVTVLGRKAELASVDTTTRAALLRRMASLWIDRFGNYAQAVKPLEELLALCPADAEAMTKLKEIYTKRRQWRALLDLLGREVPELPEGERRRHLADMAGLAADKLGDGRLAIALWNRVLEDDPKDSIALAALATLYEREKRWLALAEIYRRQREAVGSEDRRAAVAILERLGTLYVEKLAAPVQAAAMFQDILDLHPGHAKALRVLRDLYAQAGDIGKLEELYARLGAWEELVEVLHGVAERQADPGAKLAVLRRAAEIAEAQPQSPATAAAAAKAYERILLCEPRDLLAARALVPIYRKAEKWARLLSTYEILLGHAATSDERLELHQTVRKLCEEKIGSKAVAFQWAASAFELRPDEPALMKDLMRLGAEADAWDRVAEILERRLASGATGSLTDEETLRLYRELGRIRSVRLHKPDDARSAWSEVLRLRPDDPEALDALEELFTQQGRWADLLGIFRRRAELEGDSGKKIEMLFRIAFLEEERLQDPEAAARTYQEVILLEPKSQRAIRALAKVHSIRGDDAGLAQALELELEAATDLEHRVSLLLRLGGLYEERLGKRKEAFERYAQALALQPTHKGIQAALERFAGSDAEERVLVAQLLAPVFERIDEPAKLAAMLEVVRGAQPDGEARLKLDRRLMALYSKRLKDSLNAYEVGTRILVAAPEDLENRRELLALAGELSACDDLVHHLERALSRSDGDLRIALAKEVADLYDEELGKPIPAEAAWRRVLELCPDCVEAYQALARILRGPGSGPETESPRWDDLRAVLEAEELHARGAERKKEILLQLCDLYEGVLESEPGATATYQRILELDPNSLRAYKALERLYERQERWQELEALLGREAACGPSVEATELMHRRAELRTTRLGDHEGAARLAEELLRRDSGHAGGRRLLESLLSTADLKLRVAKLLEPLYEADGAWQALVSVLESQREFAVGSEELALTVRVAELMEEKLGDPAAAFESWGRAVRTHPAEESARASFLRLATRLGRWSEAAATLEEAVLEVPPGDVSLRATLYAEIAGIYDERLGDATSATSAWRRLYDLDPASPDLVRSAASALERLYQEVGAWADLIQILRRQLEWSSDAAGRAALLQRIAEIQESVLEDGAAAIATWREMLADDPQGQERDQALDALERLHVARGETRDLALVLRRRAELERETARKRQHLLRASALMERELGEPGEATSVLFEVLDFLPDDREVLAELARLLASGLRFADLLEINERRLALAQSASELTGLRFDIGQILRDRLGRPQEALERFREILADDPSCERARVAVEEALSDPDLRLRAAEILQPIYVALGDHLRLCDLLLLEAEVIVVGDPREQAARLRRVADIREVRLEDPDGAFLALCRAARFAMADPDLKDLLAQLSRIAVERERVPELVQLYRELAPEVPDAAVQRRMVLDIADLARGKLGDLALAKEYYRRALDANPDDARALDALELVYRETQEHQALRDVLVRKVQRQVPGSELDPLSVDARRETLAEVALLCEDKLGAPDDAIAAWQQVLELLPADVAASQALERLYAEKARWVELAELMEQRLGYADDLAEAVALRLRLGELHEQHLADPERALENYESVLSGDAQNVAAIAALERFLLDPALRLKAAEVLEPIYIGRQDWPKLIRITEIRLDAALDPESRLALTWRIARLCEDQLEDLEGAFRWYGKVFRDSPDDHHVREQLMRLAQVLERWDALAHVYQEHLDDRPDAQASREIARTLADIYDRRLGDVERARSAYRRVLAAASAGPAGSDDTETFTALEAMLSRAERWFALIEAYEEAIEATSEPYRRKGLLRRVAEVQEQRLKAADKAIQAYRAALEIDPEDEAVLAELYRLLQEQDLWHDLSELYLERILRASTPDARCALRVKLALVREAKIGDVAGAIDTYEQVLSEDPDDAAALSALERLVLVAEHRERIAHILEAIYRKQDAWQKLVVILGAQLEFIAEPGRRVDLLREVAQLHETRGGDLELGFRALARAWREDVSDEKVYEELERLADKLGAWEELCTTLDVGAEGIYDYGLAARILGRMARIEEVRRGRRSAAIAAWRRVLEVKEDDLGALDVLERLYAAEREFAPLVKVLEQKVELTLDVLERKELLYRVADLNEHALERKEAAVAAWNKLLALDEDDAAALDALERLYQMSGPDLPQWPALVEVLLRKADLAPDPASRRPMLLRAAQVLYGELGEAFEAIAQYRSILEEDPDDIEVLDALSRIYAGQKMWADLVEVLDRQVELVLEPAMRADLMFRAARVVEKEQGEPDQAIERYKAVLLLDGRHAATRAALADLCAHEDTLEAAASALEPVYRADALSDALVELYEKLLAVRAQDVAARRSRWAALAEVHERGRSDLAAAFAAWARLLGEDPEDTDAQRELDRLAERRGSWEELARLYEQILAQTLDGQRARHFALRLAGIYEESLGDLDRAASRFRLALEHGGDDPFCLAALDRIYERRAEWPELAHVLERQAQAASVPEDQASFLCRLGDVRERPLGDAVGAVSAYREVLDRVPSHPAARAALSRLSETHPDAEVRASVVAILEPLYQGEGAFGPLADLLEAKLKVALTPSEEAQILACLAEIAEARLGDKGRALSAAGRWLAADPASEQAQGEFIRLADVLGRWEDAASRLSEVVASAQGEDVVRDLSLHLGRILLDQLGAPDRAERAYRRVLDVEPRNPEALAALDRVYRSLGDPRSLLDVLWRRVEAEGDVGRKRELLAEAGKLAEAELGSEPDALRAWTQVMELDQGDGEAQARLAGLHERSGRWNELVELLEISARVAPDAAAERELRRRMAWTLGDKLGDLDRAADAWHAVLDLAEDDEALTALAGVQRQRKDWLGAQEALVRRLQLQTAAQGRTDILRQLAELAEIERQSSDEAIGYLLQVLEVDPGDVNAGADLERLYSALERWHELGELLSRQAEVKGTLGDVDAEVALLLRASEVWERRIDNADAASEILEKVLRRQPSHVPALVRVARLYESAGDWERCKAALERACALGPSGRDAAELYFSLGRAAEAQSEDRDQVMGWYDRALSYDPSHLPAVEARERIAREEGDWATVARFLTKREAMEEDGARKLAILVELAELYRNRLGHPAEAIQYLERGSALAPEDPKLADRLADTYFATGRAADAEPIYRRLADKAKAARRPKDVARYQQRLGMLRETAGDLAAASLAYEDAYRLDPTQSATIAGLGRIYFAHEEWQKAQRVYRSMLLQNLDPEVGVTKADVYLQLGLIHARLGESPKAKMMFERGLELDPGHVRLKEAAAQLA